jgi:arabinofuranan 3-O-arabinosyltransferase
VSSTRPAASGARSVGPEARTTGLARWLNLLCYVVLLGFSVLQHVGETTFDTKFDLTADPGTMLDRATHLWNPILNFGELQNQAYGYFFPQGPWFVALQHLGVADWLSQRLWSGLLLVAAYEGTRRLARALGLDGRGLLPVLAGLAYATSPRLLGLSGVLSAEVLPTAVLPWVVLPLVLGTSGRLSPRRAGLLSGVALLFVGGVNAVESLAVLPLAFFLVVPGLRDRTGRRLAAWWALATTLACTWWILPLLVLGRYSPPFLDYIETAASTTEPLGWANATRGADHWLSYLFIGGRPWWPGSNDLATEPTLVVLTGLVAALGYVGLFRHDMPRRGPLVASLVTGLLCLTVAHTGDLSAPVAGAVQDLLDGVLAPFRNVHKVDPLVRLPLALGLAHATGWAAARAGGRDGARRVGRVPAPGVAGLLVAVLVLAAAWPLFDGRLRKAGWDQVPSAWSQATRYLAREGTGRTLVLPGSGFGQQTWGWTIDEPIQGLATSPWVARTQVPLVPGPTIRFLDSIEERLADGIGSAALGDVLAEAGIGQVLVRRDLDLSAADVPSPARVDQALQQSTGLRHVASFGRSGFGTQPMIDVFTVTPAPRTVSAPLLADLVRIGGSTEDVVTAREAGLVRGDQAALAGPGTTEDPVDVVGDGYRRQERAFGRLHDSLSAVMAPTEPYRLHRPVHDYPAPAGIAQAYADRTGLLRVTASSSAGYADAFGPIRPDQGPGAAVDGSIATAWRSAVFTRPEGQWIRLDFDAPVRVGAVTVRASTGGLSGIPVRGLRLRTDAETRDARVGAASGIGRVLFSGRAVRSLEVEVTDVGRHTGVVGISEIEVAGHPMRTTIVVPDPGAGADTSYSFRSVPPRRACVGTVLGPQCDAAEVRSGAEPEGIDRRFTVDARGRWIGQGTVVARATPATARLLRPLDPRLTRAHASSFYASDPQVAAPFAVDGDPVTPWLAAQNDEEPTLTVVLPRRRTVSHLRLVRAAAPSTLPDRIVLRTGDQTRTVTVGPEGVGFVTPVTGRRFRLEMHAPAGADLAQRPLGVGELQLGDDPPVRRIDRTAPTGSVCGAGPTVVIDGERHATQVDGTVGELLLGQPMPWRVCDGELYLGRGEHTVRVEATSQFTTYRLDLVSHAFEPGAGVSRTTSVEEWRSTERRVRVGSGDRAVLRMAENANAGWTARLDGHTLAPVTVDGWQQGFVVPAGAGGTVTVRFAPDRIYRAGLLAGLLAAGLLVLLAGLDLALGRRSRRPARAVPVQEAPASVRSRPGRRRHVPPRPVLALVGVLLGVAVAWVLLGPVVAVGIALGAAVSPVRRLRPVVLPVAGALLVASTVLSAVSPLLAYGQPTLAADLTAALAIGLLLTHLGRRDPRRPR